MIQQSSAILNFLLAKNSSANYTTIIPLKNYSDIQSLIYGGLTSEDALSKLKWKQPPATGQEDYQNLTSVWQKENMCTFKDFLRSYNNKDVVPTLEAMQDIVDFHHSKGIDMLKLGFFCQILQKFVFPSQLLQSFIPSQRMTRICWKKCVKTWLVDLPISGNDASQLHPFSMCQAMPTGLHMRWELDLESGLVCT